MKSEFTSSIGVRLIAVAPGSFIMGSSQLELGHEYWEGEREVTLSHEFYLGATPVSGPTAKPSIFDALEAKDYALAEQILADDPDQLEGVDEVPPSLHCCIYDDRPAMLEWLLDHGADIELREQDYGATPLTTAVVHRRKGIIRTLAARGADTTRAMETAQRGLAGDFEDDSRLDREGYREIIELLRELGVE
jgi:hypothetical protein